MRMRLTVCFNSYLYVLYTNITSIGAFRLNGPGSAQLVQTFNVTEPVNQAGGVIGVFLTLLLKLFSLIRSLPDPSHIVGLAAYSA
jgi:hypothetical protein